MTLLKIARRYLNMDLFVDAEFDHDTHGRARAVIRFAAPSPASVASSDWSVGTYAVKLSGVNAELAEGWLQNNWMIGGGA